MVDNIYVKTGFFSKAVGGMKQDAKVLREKVDAFDREISVLSLEITEHSVRNELNNSLIEECDRLYNEFSNLEEELEVINDKVELIHKALENVHNIV